MNKPENKLSLSIKTAFVLAALVIIVDLILPGRIINDEIIDVQRERQQYYNAGGNYHFSYQIITSEHDFFVAEDFAESIKGNEKIEYSVSRIFKEMNWYRLVSSESKASYSLRIVSGLVLPLLLIISMLIAYRSKKNIGILVFVLQTLLLADLVFLLM